MKLDELVQKYVQLREKKALLRKQHETELEPIEKAMGLIEAAVLKHFSETGQESAKTAFGTPYMLRRTSATVADWDALLGYIRDNGAWELLERRVSKEAVQQYKAANEELPPGVNWSEAIALGVRGAEK